MDPVTAATSFATIVGLLSNFKSERTGNQLTDFTDWLKEKRHDDIASDIERNQMLAIQLKSILSLNHQELVKRLDNLDAILSSVASHVETFADLAIEIQPNSGLSGQAISIVKQFSSSGAREIRERKNVGAGQTSYHLIGAQEDLAIPEPRFAEDDFNTLVELGYLRVDYTSQGNRKFIITRQADSLANAVDR